MRTDLKVRGNIGSQILSVLPRMNAFLGASLPEYLRKNI
mgnify:CR=1 FL=1